MFDKMKKLAALALVAVVIGCGSQAPKQPAPTSEPAFTAEVKTLPQMTVAAMAKTGPYNGAGQAIMDLFKWAETNEVAPQGMPFGVYFSAPSTPPESMKYEVCLPVAPETKPDEKAGVAVKPLGGMDAAATVYVGPYEKVGPVYEKLMKWITDNGYQISGPAIEFYLSDPAKTPAESLKSEVAFPVTKAPEQKTQ